MALIKCPECNKEVSDKAEICVHCGYPISKWIKIVKRLWKRYKIRRLKK